MQKDEDDILEDWILYHGYLFGFDNLYIIDNESKPTTKCLDILKKYQKLGLHWSQESDYTKKGFYLCQLIKNTADQCDIAIPLDIDEFIAIGDLSNIPDEYSRKLSQTTLSLNHRYYIDQYRQILKEATNDQEINEHFIKKGFRYGWTSCHHSELRKPSSKETEQFLDHYKDLILKYHPHVTISCDKQQILQYLEQLPKYGRYAFNYYLTSRNGQIDYNDPLVEIQSFDLVDYENYCGKGNLNKKFFDPCQLTSLDHGNHHGSVTGLTEQQYLNTQLMLFHFHHRGVRKLIDKCKNDIIGLHIVSDLNNLIELKDKISKKVTGAHNIQTYLTYLTSGPMSLCVEDDDICFKVRTFADKISELRNKQSKINQDHL